MRLLALTLTVACVPSIQLVAQDSTYHATHQQVGGPQILAIYIGSTDCAPCRWPPLESAVHHAWPLLAMQASRAKVTFSTVGIALDDNVAGGVALLQPLEQFDEIIVGGGWTNSGAERYIWADTAATPAIPQILIVERHVGVNDDHTRWDLSSSTVLRRLIGESEIRAWVKGGALLPVGSLKHQRFLEPARDN